MAPVSRTNGLASLGAAGVIVAAACFFWVTGHDRSQAVDGGVGTVAVARPDAADTDDPTPAPSDRAAARAAYGPWYRTDLPVDGDLVAIGAETSGHVAVAREDDGAVRVTITGFRTASAHPDLRVQLTGGDVVTDRGVASWEPAGDPVEVGTLRDGERDAVIEVALPQILPDDVHSLVVLDWNTSTILGAAELVPSG